MGCSPDIPATTRIVYKIPPYYILPKCKEKKDFSNPAMFQVYYDPRVTSILNKNCLVSNFKPKYTLTRGTKGCNSLVTLPKGNLLSNSGYGSVNIWTTDFNQVVDTKKIHTQPISDMLLLTQRILLTISPEEKNMKSFYITSKLDKIFDTYFDFKPLLLHALNLLNKVKKFAITYSDGINIYKCFDRVTMRDDDEIFKDEYAKYLHQEEDPEMHTLIVSQVMYFYFPRGEISVCSLLNHNSFVFNNLFNIKIWNFEKEEKNKNNKIIPIKNYLIDERNEYERAINEEKMKNGIKPKQKKNEQKEKKNNEITEINQVNEEFFQFEKEVNKEQINNLITIKGHPKHITAICAMRDGKIASGAKDKKILIWYKKEKNENKYDIFTYLEGHLGTISTLFQLNEGNLVSGDIFSNFIIWSKNFKYQVENIYQDGQIVKFFQFGTGEFVSITSTQIKIWDFKRSYGKEKEKIVDDKNKEKIVKKKKKKKNKKKNNDDKYKLEEEDFGDILKFIEDCKKNSDEDENNEQNEEEEKNEENEKNEEKDKNEENEKDEEKEKKRKKRKKEKNGKNEKNGEKEKTEENS